MTTDCICDIFLLLILFLLRLNKVSCSHADVVQGDTGHNHLWHKLRVYFKGMQEDGPPPGLQHPKGFLKGAMGQWDV
ncbi:hypothetical protein SRHO_G00332880 [Serrasalmus rhombeus]